MYKCAIDCEVTDGSSRAPRCDNTSNNTPNSPVAHRRATAASLNYDNSQTRNRRRLNYPTQCRNNREREKRDGRFRRFLRRNTRFENTSTCVPSFRPNLSILISLSAFTQLLCSLSVRPYTAQPPPPRGGPEDKSCVTISRADKTHDDDRRTD